MELLTKIQPWAQIILSILLIGAVLLQQSEAGLGSAFGGDQSGQAFRTKRGLEKWMFIATIVLAILFGATAIAALFV